MNNKRAVLRDTAGAHTVQRWLIKDHNVTLTSFKLTCVVFKHITRYLKDPVLSDIEAGLFQVTSNATLPCYK